MRSYKFIVGFLGVLLLCTSTSATADSCYSSDQVKNLFRKEEAIRVVTDLNSRIMNVLDKVLLTTGPEDENFHPNIQYVVDLQLNQNHMDIRIENFQITEATGTNQFIDIWDKLAKLG